LYTEDKAACSTANENNVAEVMKDSDIVEPEWFNFPGREEVE
jgi:hypothetical protein